jgi:NAD(P)-dependent dehydrogenase (short-subunit alcohol dehydrogenase family)
VVASRGPGLPDEAARRVFVVTGGHAGIGYFASEQLAAAGAEVVLASRRADRADLAMQAIRRHVPDARISHIALDLSRLSAVRDAGAQIAQLPRVDGLILNAAALTQKKRTLTEDGHELVFGTNYFGNAALVAEVLPSLRHSARIVTMGSMAHGIGRIHLDDLERAQSAYRGFRTYATSKLAQMLFAVELDRRLRARNSSIISAIAHPGGALDGLTPDRPPAFVSSSRQRRAAALQRAFVQGKDRAAWPAVHAALAPEVRGGQLWGPGNRSGRAAPKVEPLRGALDDAALARELWEHTARLLDLQWDLG